MSKDIGSIKIPKTPNTPMGEGNGFKKKGTTPKTPMGESGGFKKKGTTPKTPMGESDGFKKKGTTPKTPMGESGGFEKQKKTTPKTPMGESGGFKKKGTTPKTPMGESGGFEKQKKSTPKTPKGEASGFSSPDKKKSKKKVAPLDDEMADMSPEEKASVKLQKQIRKAENYMSDNHRTKLLQTYPVGAGLIPWAIVRFLPESITRTSSVLFGKPAEYHLKGVSAAVIRMIKLDSIMVRKIKKLFQEIDFNNSENITYGQLMHTAEGVDTLFIRGLLKKTLTAYGRTKFEDFLTFEETFIIIAVVCTWSTDQILNIIFQEYAAGTGYIDGIRLTQLIKDLGNAGGAFDGNTTILIKQVDKNGDNVLSFQEFVDLYSKNPMVFYPAFKLQEVLRKKTIGLFKWRDLLDNWNKLEKERAALLKRDPISFHDQLVELATWFEEQKDRQREIKKVREGGGNQKFRSTGRKVGQVVTAFKTKEE